MYRLEDIEKINDNIKDIKDNAATAYKTYYEPTLNELSNVYNAIKNYIKKNNKIVYGGFAQNLLITKKNRDDAFYKEINGAYYNWPDLADIEFYSTTPLKDVIDLTEELHGLGFKHIEGKEGVHSETYKIFVNFINYCDISYMPTNIYNKVDTINVDGIKCIHPHFMMLDAYRIITDPMTSYWRLDKSINRFQKLIQYYPIDLSLNNKSFNLKHNIPEEVIRYIRKKIVQRSNLIVVGINAFNYYINKQNKKYIIDNVSYYEIISESLEEDATRIYKQLKNHFPNKITTKEYYPFYAYLDNRIEYYYDNQLILVLYGNNKRCTVYNFSKKKHIYYGTFNLVYLYLMYNYYYNEINNNKFNKELYLSLAGKLFETRNSYLKEHKISVIDESPFQDFTFKCFGLPVDPLRSSFLEMKEKKKEGRRMKFRYEPSGKKGKVPEFMFANSSGNEIINKKYLILKN